MNIQQTLIMVSKYMEAQWNRHEKQITKILVIHHIVEFI